MGYLLEIQNLQKAFTKVNERQKKLPVLTGINLTVKAGEIICILGNTGSGKTTLLNIISGIEKADEGDVKISEGVRVGYVFQSNAVFPWRTVERNLTYALELKGIRKSGLRARAIELCTLIGLTPDRFLNKYPKELSGGENRRLALGMMLAYEANLLLLDEPTSQLDYFTACTIQETILELQNLQKFSVILVTHNIEEALFIGHRVIILKDGIIHSNLLLDFPWPRTKEIRNSNEIQEKKNLIYNIFQSDGSN